MKIPAVREFQELDSTNNHALRIFDELRDGETVTALRQSAGHGRDGSVWLSEGKGLYFSLAVKPRNPKTFAFASLTQLLCVCVCAALEKHRLTPRIKWPNDVLCEGRKICGILCQAAANGGTLTGSVAGAGINLSQRTEDFPPDLRCPAASFATLGQPVPDRLLLLKNILEEYGRRRPEFAKRGFAAIAQEYGARLAFVGEQAVLRQNGQLFSGITIGVDGQGCLMLKTEDGIRTFYAGELAL